MGEKLIEEERRDNEQGQGQGHGERTRTWGTDKAANQSQVTHPLLNFNSCEELAEVCNGGGKCIGDDVAPSFGIMTDEAGAW